MADHPYLVDLPAYVLGALPADERRRLDDHLGSGCPLCAEELADLEATVARIPYALASVPVPPSIKRKLFERIDGFVQASPARHTQSGQDGVRRRPRSRVQTFALAASLLLAASTTLLWWKTRVRLLEQEGRLASIQQQTKGLEVTLARQEKAVAWLRDPRIQIALLNGLEKTSTVKAKLLFHPSSDEALLYVDGLPPLPVEKSYQLWAFAADEPLPAGVFDSRSGEPAVISMASAKSFPEKPKRFAVSVEPRGGVPKPTGAIVLIGDVL